MSLHSNHSNQGNRSQCRRNKTQHQHRLICTQTAARAVVRIPNSHRENARQARQASSHVVCCRTFRLETRLTPWGRRPHDMTTDFMSVTSSQWSDERSMVLHLILTTLAGEETQLTIELQEYGRFYEFENAVLEQLPNIGESSTFGCELDFVCRDTHRKLVDPIWNTLRNNNCFTVISCPCSAEAEHKGQMKGDAKAIRVRYHTTDRILPQAFSYITEVRRVQVDAGIRIIGEAAWRNCQRLQILHLSSTVICLQTRVFRRWYALRTVLAPGCKQGGTQAVEECCSLTQIGVNSDTTNQLAPGRVDA